MLAINFGTKTPTIKPRPWDIRSGDPPEVEKAKRHLAQLKKERDSKNPGKSPEELSNYLDRYLKPNLRTKVPDADVILPFVQGYLEGTSPEAIQLENGKSVIGGLITQGVDLNKRHKYGETLLHSLSGLGQYKVVKYLLQKRGIGEPDLKNSLGQTPQERLQAEIKSTNKHQPNPDANIRAIQEARQKTLEVLEQFEKRKDSFRRIAFETIKNRFPQLIDGLKKSNAKKAKRAKEAAEALEKTQKEAKDAAEKAKEELLRMLEEEPKTKKSKSAKKRVQATERRKLEEKKAAEKAMLVQSKLSPSSIIISETSSSKPGMSQVAPPQNKAAKEFMRKRLAYVSKVIPTNSFFTKSRLRGTDSYDGSLSEAYVSSRNEEYESEIKRRNSTENHRRTSAMGMT